MLWYLADRIWEGVPCCWHRIRGSGLYLRWLWLWARSRESRARSQAVGSRTEDEGRTASASRSVSPTFPAGTEENAVCDRQTGQHHKQSLKTGKRVKEFPFQQSL